MLPVSHGPRDITLVCGALRSWHRRWCLRPGALQALLNDIDEGAYAVEDLEMGDYRRMRALQLLPELT